MVAGGRTFVNLRDMQSMVFMARRQRADGRQLFDHPANQPVERKDLQMLKDLGLDPSWDSSRGFSDQEEESGCGCGNGKCHDTETALA